MLSLSNRARCHLAGSWDLGKQNLWQVSATEQGMLEWDYTGRPSQASMQRLEGKASVYPEETSSGYPCPLLPTLLVATMRQLV